MRRPASPQRISPGNDRAIPETRPRKATEMQIESTIATRTGTVARPAPRRRDAATWQGGPPGRHAADLRQTCERTQARREVGPVSSEAGG